MVISRLLSCTNSSPACRLLYFRIRHKFRSQSQCFDGAGEYLVQVIAKFVHKEFGFIKVCFDVSLVLIACVLSATFLSNIEGVREGTVIAALAVGPISHLLLPYWRIFDSWLQPIQPYQASYTDNQPIIITIAREYGSGGHLLGKMLAERLNIKFYDKELISMVANDSHFSPKYIAENEQKFHPIIY